MQRKSSAQHKAVVDAQRSAAAQPAARVAREPRSAPAAILGQNGSGETTLGGHVDRGLTLAALYDIGVLERLRLEVRLRLLADLAQSLAWLHANPRLMAAHPHLVIAPSTIVIGLDGVARVDVRAAKKQESERNLSELDYVAPELASGAVADLRADIYSLGVLTWEAIAGKRISAPDAWPSDVLPLPEGASPSDLPAALGGGKERDPLRRKAPPTPAARPAPKTSYSRLRIPPPLVLPEDGEWAQSLAELALQAMSADPAERPQTCRPLLLELEHVANQLADTQEIAEVVQGISAVETLCIPPPTLPDVDAKCQPVASGAVAFLDRQPCCDPVAPTCAQRQVPAARRVIEAPVAPEPPPPPVVVPPSARGAEPISQTVKQLTRLGTSSSNTLWFVAAGLLGLALLGLLAGYAATLLAMR